MLMKACCGSKITSLICAYIKLHILSAQEHHACEIASLELTIPEICKLLHLTCVFDTVLVFGKVRILLGFS